MDLSILISPGRDSAQTRTCLESLTRTLSPQRGLDWEAVLFDPSAASDISDARFRALPHVSAPSLAASRNAAVATARAPLLCFLSPGAVLLPDWLPPVEKLLHQAPLAGCIGNVHREPYSGLIDHAGLRFDAAGLPVPVARITALLPRETHDRQPAVSLACALVSRTLVEQLGGFDEGFGGSLGDVDFCLRAATLGYRHYVANRSVIYHHSDAPDTFTPADLTLFRSRWGDPARAAHARRARLHANPDAPYTPESWEMARELRRLRRQEIRDIRCDGNAYLRKHLHRPWRYNYGRLCRALVKAWQPLPPALPLTPGRPFNDAADTTRPDDGWLFDPPPR